MRLRISFLMLLLVSTGFVSTVHINLFAQTKKNPKNIVYREAKETVTPIELSYGNIVGFKGKNGNTLNFELVSTDANILFSNRDKIPPDESGNDRGNMYRARLLFEITADVLVNGMPMTMRKYVGSQESYYEPYVINGIRIWFDAVSDLFEEDGGFLNTHRGGNLIDKEKGVPRNKARFVFQDMTSRICPGEIKAWFKDGDNRDNNYIYQDNFIDVGRSFNGDDIYLGAYLGGESHGALDINMAMNSTMYAPFDLDTQSGIRAAGTKTWPDGSVWSKNTGHIIEKYVPDNTPLKAGMPYGKGARRACWWHPHAHFGFNIIEGGIDYVVDPWIIFWQHFEDNKMRDGVLKAQMEPLAHSKTGTKVKFRSLCQYNDDRCSDISYYWAFGDGGWSEESSPEYVFARPGVYPVTLTIDNGKELASFTQHITVEGIAQSKPSIVLLSDDEPAFRPRPLDAMDIYSYPVKFIPHTIEFLSRPTRPVPDVKKIMVKNSAGGKLNTPCYGIDYRLGIDWVKIDLIEEGENQALNVSVNGKGLSPGKYFAVISVHSEGAINSPQSFRVSMNIPDQPAQSIGVIIDDKDPGFYCTPYFWVGHRFHGWGWPELKEAEGYNHFYLINGQKTKEGELARFTPDLQAGTYDVWLYERTPFASGPPANNEPCRFQVRVHAAEKDTVVWMEPKRMTGFYPRPWKNQQGWNWLEPQPTRKIGTFRFEEGKDGFVEILAAGSTGQVIVDAVRFLKKDE